MHLSSCALFLWAKVYVVLCHSAVLRHLVNEFRSSSGSRQPS